MKLEGSLDAFSLPDMFQLLSFTKKTGGLHLAGEDSDGVVFFAGGQVTGASADGSRQPLARRLVGSGVVDDESLAAAVDAATNGEGLGVVRALLDHEAVDEALLKQAATDQAVDAVFDLLRWSSGDFAFVVEEANPDDVGVTLDVESVLADASKRSAAWETVSQVVPTPQAVLAMPVVLPADPSVSREEWSLLALVDGRRSVADLVDLTGSGQYAVVSTLAALVQRGLLEVHGGGESEDEDADHVAVVVRRQQLLAPLEGQPFTPLVEVPSDADADASDDAHGSRDSQPDRERRRATDPRRRRTRRPTTRARPPARHRVRGPGRGPEHARRRARAARRRAAAQRALPAQAPGGLRRGARLARGPPRPRPGRAVRHRRRRRSARPRPRRTPTRPRSSSATRTSTAA